MVPKTVNDSPTNGWQSIPNGSVDAPVVGYHQLRLRSGGDKAHDRSQSQTTYQQDGPLVKGWTIYVQPSMGSSPCAGSL